MSRRFERIAALVLLVLLAIAPARAEDAARRKIIIDDDGFGLMHLMLVHATEVEVLGITTVSGDVWANRATAMTLRGLEIAARSDVPVMQGATYPLLNSEVLTDRWEGLYGKLTWRGAWMKQWVEPTAQSTPVYHGPNDPIDLPWGNPAHKPSPEIAALYLLRMVHQYPGQITIVACGPLTNLALAQRLDPQFAELAAGLVVMGGSFNPHQVLPDRSAADFAREFANTPRREFNIRFDPEAASIVWHSPWRQITVVPVDPSTATQRRPDLQKRMAAVASPELGRFIAAMEPGFPLWDETAAGVLLDPAMVTDKETLYIDADTQFGAGYGDTLSWREHYQPGLGERPATVVHAIDPARLEALMVRTIGQSAKGKR